MKQKTLALLVTDEEVRLLRELVVPLFRDTDRQALARALDEALDAVLRMDEPMYPGAAVMAKRGASGEERLYVRVTPLELTESYHSWICYESRDVFPYADWADLTGHRPLTEEERENYGLPKGEK